MIRILGIIIVALFLSTNTYAGTDGSVELSEKKNTETKDCFEKVNRGVFAFNQAVNDVVFEPLAKGYRKLPSPVRTGTSNALSNLSILLTLPNNLLQGDIFIAGKNSLRFVVNTTLGILGIFDPATKLGLDDYQREDFGQTLGRWGIEEGCYIVLPILGPSTLRDTAGSIGNYIGGDTWYNITVRNDTHYFSNFDYYASKGMEGVDFIAKNLGALDNLEENSIDFYASVKSLYLQDRRKRILNATGATQTQDDSDWEEIE